MDDQSLVKRGPLRYAKKASAPANEWKQRYYIVRPVEGNLVACELTEKDSPSPAGPVGLLQLFNARVQDLDAAQIHPTVASGMHAFQVVPATGKAWFLAASSQQELAEWKTSIEMAIKLAPSETEGERHKQIDKLILQEKKQLSRCPELKLLLLGPGHSGKSTILKQMKILHCNGFLPGEREFYKGLCRSNILDSMKQLLDASESLRLKLSAESQAMAATFLKYFEEVNSQTNSHGIYTNSENNPAPADGDKTRRGTSYSSLSSINTLPRGTQITQGTITIPPEVAKCIKDLWADELIHKDTMAHAPEFHLPDSTVYFLDAVDRIAQDNYEPTSQDILRSRHRTSGVHETVFLVEDTKFRIIDVGGQRGERKKWIQCFEDVTAVLFVAAISEYDQKLREDDTTNRLHEALAVFESICKIKAFANIPIILFLNKDDIFQEKIKNVPLTVCFPKYEGENTYAAYKTYISQKFERRKVNKDRIIYTHVINATDTESFKKVSQATQDIILTKALHDAHL
jgi:GTPase SAR1 family protein